MAVFALLGSPIARAGENKWTRTPLYGGSSYAVAVNPKNAAVVYEASPGAGVFKSTDGGLTWAAANVGLTDLGVQTLAIDPTNPSVLYTSGQIDVFKSTDGAKTWSVVGAVYLGRQFVVDPSTPATIYGLAGANANIAVEKSVNGGKTWTEVSYSNGLNDFFLASLAMDPRSSSTLYVAARSGVWKTTDGAKTWALSTTGLVGQYPFMNAVAVNPQNDQILYAVSDSSPTGSESGQGVFKSLDGGKTWAASGVGLPSRYDETLVVVDPATPSRVYVVGGGPFAPNALYVSRDSGAHWAASDTGLPRKFSANFWSLAIAASAPATLYLGTDLGVYASLDKGAKWNRRVAGLANMYVNAVAVDPVTPSIVYAATAFSGVFKSVDGAMTWATINNGLPGGWLGRSFNGVSSIVLNPRNPQELLIGAGSGQNGQADNIFKSVDAGATWKLSLGGVLSKCACSISALVMDPSHPKTLFAADERGNGGVAESTDGGATWAFVNSGLPNYTPIEQMLLSGNSLAIASHPPGKSLAVYVSPYVAGSAPAWAPVSVASALTFVDSFLGVQATVQEIAQFLTDFGWTIPGASGHSSPKFNPSACSPFTGAFRDPYVRKNFYVTGQCGVVLVSNLAAKVGTMDAGLPANLAVNALATNPSGKVLYAATAGGGVYKYTISP